ncbi:OmpH family outer membrane protein [Microscilla marina]|uniref:Cationic outer membrane protein n=1 Tax=Microscilla marina ATCC 23134 TaxID=313606 RepID=A1ZP34_MICM2|nr:OmpH family outer membrane protein [Microscilla marina]EAY27826.1 cationic outer membrane protein [Microscilla marina ATCC 23134]
MLKSVFFSLACILVSATYASAQKFGFIDSNFILQQMESYKKAKAEIDKAATNWQQQVEAKLKAVERMRAKYIQEEILLTAEMKDERQKEIAKKEQEAREYQKKVFGYEGLLFQRRQELIKPAQEELQKAVKRVARRYKIQVVFDKSSDLIMIYASPTHDYTERVLVQLGLAEED